MSGCESKDAMDALKGVPDDVFKHEPYYTGPLNTVGGLSTGYIQNTTSLDAAHNKLDTLCKAAKRCPKDTEE